MKGTINGSEPLDIIFDTGANGHVVNSAALASKKIEMVFDGETRDGSAGGFKTVETSSSNKVTAGSLSLEDASFLSIDFGDSGFDVVLGWNAFADQAIEIDYDRKELIVHDPGDLPTDGYLKFEMRLLRGLPYIESKVYCGLESSAASGWLEFDTGSDWSLQLSQSCATTHDLDGKLKQIGKASGMGSNGISFDLTVVVARTQ